MLGGYAPAVNSVLVCSIGRMFRDFGMPNIL